MLDEGSSIRCREVEEKGGFPPLCLRKKEREEKRSVCA